MGLLEHVENEIKEIVIKVLVDLGLYSPPAPPAATTTGTATNTTTDTTAAGGGGGTDLPPKQAE